MTYAPKIYIHAPYKPEARQALVKQAVMKHIRGKGFDPQEFHISGFPKGTSWTFSRAIEVMRQCDGALILALKRHLGPDGSTPVSSEYSHFEGALALAFNLPTIIIAEEGMAERGILAQVGGSFVLKVPTSNSAEWLANDRLLAEPPFEEWVDEINNRYDVFFGYCSKANKLAQNLKGFLTNECGMRVLDWPTDFQPGRTIMEEIARATATCRCGLFLFTADDPIEGSPTRTAMPRDNVLLEAGYFMSAHTARRMVVIREKGTQMPADLGGMIYLTIENRKKWKEVAKEAADCLRMQMAKDVYKR